MILRVLSFFRSPLGLSLLGAFAALVALFVFGRWEYSRGVGAEKAAQELRNEAAQKEAAKQSAKAAEVGARVGASVEAAVAKETIVTRTLIQKVPIYVPTPSPSSPSPSLPLGFVRLHNAAAAGLLSPAPFAPGESPSTPSGVALPALGEVIVTNYGACRENAEELKGWQDWYAAVAPTFQGAKQ